MRVLAAALSGGTVESFLSDCAAALFQSFHLQMLLRSDKTYINDVVFEKDSLLSEARPISGDSPEPVGLADVARVETRPLPGAHCVGSHRSTREDIHNQVVRVAAIIIVDACCSPHLQAIPRIFSLPCKPLTTHV